MATKLSLDDRNIEFRLALGEERKQLFSRIEQLDKLESALSALLPIQLTTGLLSKLTHGASSKIRKSFKENMAPRISGTLIGGPKSDEKSKRRRRKNAVKGRPTDYDTVAKEVMSYLRSIKSAVVASTIRHALHRSPVVISATLKRMKRDGSVMEIAAPAKNGGRPRSTWALKA